MPSSPLDPFVQERVDRTLELIAPRLVEFRRHLHQHPELSLGEFSTTAFIARTLRAEGIDVRLGTGNRGLIADHGPEIPGLRIAVRADCDALPISEENLFPHASSQPGVMHACGHDAHTAMLLGAMITLHHARVPVPVRAIFQPAEEMGDGALGMIADGALERISHIIAIHVDPNLDTGFAAAVPGPQTASCQDFSITVRGRGGHAARPHLTVDPVAIAAALITLIYQALPRHINTQQPVVVSICQIHAGHASNVIPDTAVLEGTIRSHNESSAVAAKAKLEQVCEGVGATFGAGVIPVFGRRIPGVVNDPSVSGVCAAAAREIFGADAVLTAGLPSYGAEDFADYLQEVPGCMMRLGVKYPDRPVTPLHTPTFDVDETALIYGSRLLLRSVLRLALPPC